MIIDMQLKKPLPQQSKVTCNLKYVVESLNEYIEHADWAEDEIKAVEQFVGFTSLTDGKNESIDGFEMLTSALRNSNEIAKGLKDIVRYLEIIISISERQDRGRTIIFD